MKRILLIAILFIAPFIAFSQEEDKKEEPKDGWHKAGNISLLFNQAAFNAEWTGGGTTNYSANLSLTYDFNYKKDKFLWDNRIMADYGITRIREDEFSRKTNDRLELNSLAGKQIKESNWYYSYFLNFKTQFTSGYEFGEDAMGNTTRTEITKFLSPGYLQTGPGLLWKKSDNLKVNIAPATARLIFVDGSFTEVDETIPGAVDAYNENKYFGVDANESTRFELGASISAYAKVVLMEDISIENILNLYSNYLEDPQNVDIDYTLNLVMAVNKWISANVTFQAIYDDNAVQGFQIREALGIGVTYGF
jgi:hypothetical protein